MKRVIVNYKKLNKDILNLLLNKFPDGYSDRDIISFKNHHNTTIEAVEVRTNDTAYLVKISERLAGVMQDYEESSRSGSEIPIGMNSEELKGDINFEE